MGELGILWGDLITPQKPCYNILPLYVYEWLFIHFQQLKNIEDYIQVYMISYKIFFQLVVTVFKENLNLQLPLIFYSSIRFVFETVFISEQILENWFGSLLEVSNKFITRYNVFSYIMLQFRLKTVWKISKPYFMTLKTLARQFCLKGHSSYHESKG